MTEHVPVTEIRGSGRSQTSDKFLFLQQPNDSAAIKF